jgi:hypothetical protein
VDVNFHALTDVAIKYQPFGPYISESHTDKTNLRHLFKSPLVCSAQLRKKMICCFDDKLKLAGQTEDYRTKTTNFIDNPGPLC